MRSALPALVAAVATLCGACGDASSEVHALPPSALDGAALLTVGFVVVDGVYNTELTAPMDMFHHTVFHAQPGMRVFTVGRGPLPGNGPVTTFEGLRLLPDHDFESAPPVDVLVVPSAEHSMDTDLEDEALLGYVRRAGAEAAYVLSLCDGAFVLAAAGLLEGREATTFPADVARLREDFPGLVVHEGLSFVHDGKVVTSAGGALSFEAALYLCELIYGGEAADGIARGLVIDWDLGAVAHRVVR